MPIEWLPLGLSLRVAGLATLFSVVGGLWIAALLERRRFWGSRALGNALSASIALPAPVICYFLGAAAGRFWSLGEPGLLLAAVLSAAPVFVRGARTAFAGIDSVFQASALSLGASEWRVFSRVELPLAVRPALAATALAFIRVLAELAAAQWLTLSLAGPAR